MLHLKFCLQPIDFSNILQLEINEFDHYDLDELLVKEVSQRVQLYDFSLPSSQRSRDITYKLWEEVSENLHGNIYSTSISIC